MKMLTFLSNGHGEDAIGVLLARALSKQHPELQMQAFPTVDTGQAYAHEGIKVLGPRRVMPSGGLLFHNFDLFKQDIRAGFVGMTRQQVWQLSQLKTDVLVVIGDAYALLLSSLVRCQRRYFVQSLVSAHHAQVKTGQLNRFFMERVSYPERALMRHLATQVYVRDKATERQLRSYGLSHVQALGNPMLDALSGQVMPEHQRQPRVALLPGTRRYANEAFLLMLESLTHLPGVTGLLAWAGGETLPEVPGWEKQRPSSSQEGLLMVLSKGQQQVFMYEGRFADILQTADLVLGTSGTANEQAAALGKPVVSFPVVPLYSSEFLQNQKRLLADALILTQAEPRLIAEALKRLYEDKTWYQRAARAGRERMGEPGGSFKIAADIIRQLT